jgi:hypothetical protein
VETDGIFNLSIDAPTATPDAGRDCTVLFRGPPGSVLAFDWQSFSVGSCAAESVVLKDGWSETHANKVGDTLCGSSSAPTSAYFSGNTARLEMYLLAGSTFTIWVNHYMNQFSFSIPYPTFQLGSDITIGYSLSLAQASLSTQSFVEHSPSPSSHPTDSGWVGLFRDGECASGIEAHECFLVSQPAVAGDNNLRFYFDDYKQGGWYEVRYFAGESAGTTCGVPEELSDVNQTAWVVPNRCTFEPIATDRFYVTPNREEFGSTGAAMKAAIPGFERIVHL